MTAHTNCSHPATRTARAACRRQRGKAQPEQSKPTPAAKPKAKKIVRLAPDGTECTSAEHQALINISRSDYPAVDSNEVCRSIRDKGFASFNTTHNCWQLSVAGQALVRMQ